MSGEELNTFVVIDLETNGFPTEQFNKCSITEMSLYAFSAKCLVDRELESTHIPKMIAEDGIKGLDTIIPQLPRVLHKLTLMINPQRLIFPSAEQVTGLSNDMLENESSFDKNAANCLNSFLERLEQPVCLVAHNGWTFDYPIIRHVYEKIKMSLPSSVYCVDSFIAFREIDEKKERLKEAKKVLKILEADEKEFNNYQQCKNEEKSDVLPTIVSDPLEQSSQINWQQDNESTPKRKRDIEKCISLTDCDTPAKKRIVSLTVRRSLFADNFKPKSKYPPRGLYKLGNIYKRCFNQEPKNLHRAESDVEILSKIILHYGLDFLAYAEERKALFSKVPKLGSSN